MWICGAAQLAAARCLRGLLSLSWNGGSGTGSWSSFLFPLVGNYKSVAARIGRAMQYEGGWVAG